MNRLHRFGLMFCTLACMACGAVSLDNLHHLTHDNTEHPPHAIVGGTLVAADQWQAAHTLVLIGGHGKHFCTATRIGPNQIVTAAHCLDNPMPAMSIGYGAALSLANCTSFSKECPSQEPVQDKAIKIIATTIHPAFVADTHAKNASDFYDIGLILFEGDMPIAITPVGDFADFPTKTANLHKASILVKTGYGAISENDTSPTALRTVDLQVTRLDEQNYELEYQRGTGKGTCNGDSGGPGFVTGASTPRLVGITSRGPEVAGFRAHHPKEEASCEEGNGIDTDARYYRAWLDCTARALHERFKAEGVALSPLDVHVEPGDPSAKDCDRTRIESHTEAYLRVKQQCESRKHHTYDELAGECLITSKSECEKAGGTWHSKKHTCDL